MSAKSLFSHSLILCLALALCFSGNTLADTAPRAVSVWLESLPALTAPGACMGLNWATSGGSVCEETHVAWDTVTRAHSQTYAHRTPSQSGGMTHYYDWLDVPIGASDIYVRAYATIDGVSCYSDEYRVLTVRAIDVGSDSPAFDSTGLRWYPDTGYVDGRYAFTGGTPYAVSRPIADTEEDWLYQTQREGVTGFTINLTLGVYRMAVDVEFHLAELQVDAAGQRVFDIYLERGTPDEVLIPSVDIYDRVGKDHALILARTVTVSDRRLYIAFVPKTSKSPVLNGLVLRGAHALGQRATLSTIAGLDDDTYVNSGTNLRRAAELLIGGQSAYHVGLRFWAVQVPQRAIINHAELRLYPSQDHYALMDINVYAEAADNALDFTMWPQVPARPRTSQSARWIVGHNDGWHPGEQVTSPELRDVIQEVVDRDGWASFNELALLLIANQGDFTPRSVWALDGSPNDRAVLYVEYTDRAILTPTPTPSPTATGTPTVTATPSLTPTCTPPAVVLSLPLLLKPWLLP